MNLYHYLVRLETVLHSRQDIDIRLLQIDAVTIGVKFKSELRFYDGSCLSIVEQLEPVGARDFNRTAYKFHYQDKDGDLIFRYDNSPHYPHLSTFPAHKHIGSHIVEAEPPDLNDVLAEIDAIIYPNAETKKPE
ncbi:MAG: DUF6516 family protein [Anaerolineae bacterium]